MAATDYGEGQLRQAFNWAAGLIVIAKRLVAERRADIDLAPIAPAIKEVCALAVDLPPDRAEKWIDRLIILQQDLTLLSQALNALPSSPRTPTATPGEG